MSLLARFLPRQFGDATQRAVKNTPYVVSNPAAFNKAVFTGGKVTEGEKLVCTGKNEGGWPEFRRANGLPESAANDTREIISMTYRAKGTPGSYGLTCEKNG